MDAPCERLAALRAAMAAADGGRGVAAYVVPSEDPHMSEYAPECFQRRKWLTKFTGSAGWAVVTADQALLWTDARYFLQAQQELGKEWTLMKAGMPGFPDMEDWLALTLPEGGRVGIDPFCHTVDAVRRMLHKLKESGREVVPLLADGNLVDRAWGASRPALPTTPLRVHAIRWAGEEVASKVARMQGLMAQNKADALVVTMLDEVMWLFNIRGSDVACNPVAVAYALVCVPKEGVAPATLYVDKSKVTPEVAEHLKAAGVEVAEYGTFLDDVRGVTQAGGSVWLDTSKASYAVFQAAKEAAAGAQAGGGSRKRPRTEEGSEGANGAAAATNGMAAPAKEAAAVVPAPAAHPVVEASSPVVAAKAVKNTAELAGMREAHLRDAVALVDFLHYIEQEMAGGRTLSEVEVDKQLTARRAAQQGFVEPSFPTIAGAGPNGAVIHYRAQPDTCRTVDASTLLLLDSGGQYDCGTTDITRTMHFGTPTEHQKRCYTRVLQGHISLDRAVFPEGTPGAALDILARAPLWSDGLNYRHGTGHGVGAALNVHEGPQSISMRFHVTTPLQANMVCSNEPGYYEDGSFGIRIENLVVVTTKDTPHRYGGDQYYGFEYITLVPIQTKMVEPSLMSQAEIQWLDNYHQNVWEKVSPRLESRPELKEWLQRATRPLLEQLQQAKQ